MHRGCFVWTPTPPLAGRRTPRPGPVRVCVCSSVLAGSGGPASRARSGAPHLFIGPLCLSVLLGPLRAGVAPFLVFLFSFCFFLRAPFVTCFLWFAAPGALGLGALFSFPPRPGVCFFCFFFFFSFLPSFCAPVVSCFLWFPAPGALGLGAVCCLFCWPSASRLSVRSRLVCVSCLAVGRSLVVAAPRPLPCCVWRFSSPPLGARGFFFLLPFFSCASVVSGFLWFPAPGAAGLGAVCCLFCWPPASRLSVRTRLVCVSRLAVGCSLVVAPPPPPCVSRFLSLPIGAPFFFPFFVVRPRCLWLSLVSGPGCAGPWRRVLFALLASRFSALRALSPLLCFPPGRLLLPGGCCPPPPFVSRGFCRRRSVLCAVCCAVLCFPGCGAAPRCCALCRPVLCCCVLCCFVALVLVPLRVVPCPVVLPVALGPCALWRCVLRCSPALCALCCVCFVVACWCALLFAAVCCAVCVLGCSAVRSLSSPLCAVLCFPVLVRLRCAVCVVRAVAGAWCCGALLCVVLSSFGLLWCGAGSCGPWLSAGCVFRCRCPCLAVWSASLWLVPFAVVPCLPVSCSVVLCCRVVLCCCALLSFCVVVGACFALLWPVLLCCVALLLVCVAFCPVVVSACCGALSLPAGTHKKH